MTDEKKHPTLPLLISFCLLLGFIGGSTMLVVSDSWVNGTYALYPNSSWNTNVNVTGNLYENGSRVCTLANGLCAGTSGDNTSWNKTYADTLYYPKNTNPLGFYNSSTFTNYYPLITNPLGYYNSSTLPVNSNAPTIRKVLNTANNLQHCQLGALSPNQIGATYARCSLIEVPQNEKLSFNTILMRTTTANTSVGLTMGIYNCTDGSYLCTRGELIINTSRYASTTVGIRNVSATNWTLEPGYYRACFTNNNTVFGTTTVYAASCVTGMSEMKGINISGSGGFLPKNFTSDAWSLSAQTIGAVLLLSWT